MNNDEVSVKTLTLKQMFNCVSMIIKLKEENILNFDINTTKATLNYDEATRYLENQNVEQAKEIERLNNIIKRIKDHFIFLKINSNGGNKEFFEDIIEMIETMEELKEGK